MITTSCSAVIILDEGEEKRVPVEEKPQIQLKLFRECHWLLRSKGCGEPGIGVW